MYSSGRTPDRTSDDQLIARAAAGDTDSFQLLFTRYQQHVFGYLCYATSDPDAAADILQEAFLELWKAAPKWRSNGSILGFLMKVSRSRVIDSRRSQAARRKREGSYTEGSVAETPYDALERSEIRCAIQEALDALPPRQREAFLLARHGGLPYREIGELLGISVRTVEGHVASATSSLRQALQASEIE